MATNFFDDKLIIGQGGFGKVYRGQIFIEKTSNVVVAIKRLDSMSNQGASEFRAEIEMLSKLRHCHLVSLIGFCDDNNEMILVYAYIPNRTLYHHLHKAETPLNWMQRLNIAIGAGRGLDFLHTGVGTQQGVIHRDVKSSNILLDQNWEAMISDFGLSKICPINQSSSYVDPSVSVKGTFGYLDPEYFLTRKLTRKTDVYAFGVVLFELLSGRLAVDDRNAEDQCSLVRWAQRCVNERKLDQMVDSNISETIFPKCLRGFAQIADRCLRSVIKERPTMAKVVVSLQALLKLQHRHDNLPEPSSITGFTWKIHKYLLPAVKQGPGIHKHGKMSTNLGATHILSATKQGPGIHKHFTMSTNLGATHLKVFTFDELIRATKNFGIDTCLSRHKSYKPVYKGWIDKKTYSPSGYYIGLPIVIRHMKFSDEVDQLKLEALKEYSHENLVKLIGYCLEGFQVFLVHEFVPNGNLKGLLDNGAVARLGLVKKVKIAVGIARGIVFLSNTQKHVEEFWLKRQNILLDQEFTVKLSDYDVFKLVFGDKCPVPGMGMFQPQYNLSGFTEVFAEVLTGKRIHDEYELQKIDKLFIQHGKMSFTDIAKLCFEICNEVDSELKMLRILEKYEPHLEQYIEQIDTWNFSRSDTRDVWYEGKVHFGSFM